MKTAAFLVLALALLARAAPAQPLALPRPPQAGIEQQVGAQLPLALPVVDERGHAGTLRESFADGTPVLLVPGYYTCPELCGLVMHGVLEAVHDARRPVRIVRVSIDPQDTPATAAAQRARDLAYADALGGPPPDLHLLVADAPATGRLAAAIGYRYERTRSDDAPAARFAHPAAVLVVTPQGRISRYLMGVRFDAAQLRSAVDDAARGRVGTLTDRIALLCAHFDPRVGRHSDLVMNALRAVGLLTVAGLGGWCWRRRGPPPGAAS